MNDATKEFSAGGVIIENEKILLILVQNLKGERVWTFPKGHIESGETSEEAALREVWEETGYRCDIKKKIYVSKYFFIRHSGTVEKEVAWYLMEKTGGDGKPVTQDEIIDLGWFSEEEVLGKIRYPSDKKIMNILALEIKK